MNRMVGGSGQSAEQCYFPKDSYVYRHPVWIPRHSPLHETVRQVPTIQSAKLVVCLIEKIHGVLLK